jgi:hypothetical protein
MLKTFLDIPHYRRAGEKQWRASRRFDRRVAEVVERMMIEFHAYAADFNMALGWNLHMSATPPTFVTEDYVLTYRARLGTRLWSLVLRAEHDSIGFFLIPSATLIGFAKATKPAMTLRFTNDSGWLLDDCSWDAVDGIDELCKILFKMLVARCIEETDNTNDPFAPLAVAIEPQKISIGEFLQRMQKEVEAAENAWESLPPQGKDSQEQNRPEEPQMTRYDVYNDVLLSFTFLIERTEREVQDVVEQGTQAFCRRDLQAIKRASIDLLSAQANEKAARELRDDWGQLHEVADALSASGTDFGIRGICHDPFAEDLDVDSALEQVALAVDAVLESIVMRGAEAFSARDFAKVDLLRRHALYVIEFNNRLNSAREKWSKPRPINTSLRQPVSAAAIADPAPAKAVV